MRRRRLPMIAGFAAFALALTIGFLVIGSESSDAVTPADPTALQRIARKNDAAATLAAARMKAESRRSNEAADALAANQAPAGPQP